MKAGQYRAIIADAKAMAVSLAEVPDDEDAATIADLLRNWASTTETWVMRQEEKDEAGTLPRDALPRAL